MLLATLLFAASCSNKDILEDGTYPSGSMNYSITVSDGGFASADAPQTRVVEKGYATEFTNGDLAGLYAVDADGVVKLKNVKVTATEDGTGEIVWSLPEGTSLWHSDDMNYFLYYPYQDDMTDKVNANSTASAEGFFAPLIEDWQPKADQTEYAAYTASDLMVGKGTVGTVENHVVPLSFALMHCMALAVVEAPCTRYHITTYNSEKTECDITIYSHTDIGFTGDTQPYFYSSDHYYRYIVHPERNFTLTGSYTDTTNEYVYDFTVKKGESDLKAGLYTRYKVNNGLKTIRGDYHELKLVRVGDLFCPTENRTDWYLVPHEVDKLAEDDKPSGIVFQTDKRRFGTAEKEFFKGREKMHGLVVSVKSGVTVTKTYWSNNDEGDTGLHNCTTLEDCYNNINGLYNCNYIKENYNGFEQFPAFKAADEHGDICPIPTGNKTTGWYLPASGQWWDIVQNLGGVQEMAETKYQTSQEDLSSAPKIRPEDREKDIISAMNEWMEKISEEGKVEFSVGSSWSSSEYNAKSGVNCNPSKNNITFSVAQKNLNPHGVRPVLAF